MNARQHLTALRDDFAKFAQEDANARDVAAQSGDMGHYNYLDGCARTYQSCAEALTLFLQDLPEEAPL